jgi:lysyl-tRNA synthetase class 2
MNLSSSQLINRARFLKNLREFLDHQGFIEITAPCIGKNACPDVAVEPISFSIFQENCFLQPSPELYLKKILAKYPLDCYSLGPVFRADLPGKYHNIEFLMLEFYKMGQDAYPIIKELTIEICKKIIGAREVEFFSYEAIWEFITKEPYHYSSEYFSSLLKRKNIDFDPSWDTRTLEDLAFSFCCQPFLGINTITILDGFPPHQAALAQINEKSIAERFEVFINGFELANGYHELSDFETNKKRFEDWTQQRDALNMNSWEIDQNYLTAMRTFPSCSGVAIGLERLIMLGLQEKSLANSMAFHWSTL